ncbi:MAG TPA: UPF0261 family protein [Planctomycetes bacterium]|nr:UPF0261 family protein [Planctomycetota bacterium]
MKPRVVILATLDTKACEASFLTSRIREGGGRPLLVDVGVLGTPGCEADISRGEVAAAGGVSLGELVATADRGLAAPVMARGAQALVSTLVGEGEVQAVIGLGGTQGTTLCTSVMQALPYGLPKIMVSTVASGDTSPFVGIKDITMMFSVGDLLGLNPFTRQVLAHAAGAALGMAGARLSEGTSWSGRPVVGMTNLGVLTQGALEAVRLLEAAGREVIVFHAVGSGGRAMEQMLKEGLIHEVFDYALGEISDELWGGLRSAGPERLTVAAGMGLPQVVVPGGAEHLGLLVDPPNTVPEDWKDHVHVFHSPVVFVPRLRGDELVRVADTIAERLGDAGAGTALYLPEGGTSRYSVEGGPLHDPRADRMFFEALEARLASRIEVRRLPHGVEEPEFIAEAVAALLAFSS